MYLYDIYILRSFVTENSINKRNAFNLMDKKFEFLKHTADIKFRAYGKSIEELYENSVLAISNVLSRNGKIKELKKKIFTVNGKDYEEMLYKLIEELIYLFDAKGFVVSKAKVKIDKMNMEVIAYGDDTKKYSDLDAIKSPTYAEMYVKRTLQKCPKFSKRSLKLQNLTILEAVNFAMGLIQTPLKENKHGWECQVVVDV